MHSFYAMHSLPMHCSLQVSGVHVCDSDTRIGHDTAKQSACPAVDVVARHDVVATAEESGHCSQRRHAAGEDKATVAALQEGRGGCCSGAGGGKACM